MTVGVIGNGFVGNSIYHTFMPSIEVKVYDINPDRSTHELHEVLAQDVIFCCVPTPMRSSGEIDLSYIEGVFETAVKKYEEMNYTEQQIKDKVFVIKSTAVPTITEKMIEKSGLRIVFSPEFLTERTAVSDSICSNHAIVGGEREACEIVESLFKARFGAGYNVLITDAKTASFIKYMRNAFFATKVTYMNEMFRIAVNSGIDWETAVSGFAMDGRIGHSHLQVPGHDGMYGYGGTCFPKDLSAITIHSRQQGFDPQLLMAVQEANLTYRGIEDWKEKVGRAISE